MDIIMFLADADGRERTRIILANFCLNPLKKLKLLRIVGRIIIERKLAFKELT